MFDELSNKLNDLTDKIESGSFAAKKKDEILNNFEIFSYYRNNITNTNIANIDNIENIFENYVNS